VTAEQWVADSHPKAIIVVVRRMDNWFSFYDVSGT
jgi:hypothetical protein